MHMVRIRKLYSSKVIISILFLSLFLFVSAKDSSSNQRLINFQGYLTDQAGSVYEDGTYTIIFSLYGTPNGGTPLWSERHESVSVTKGLVNVLLGSITSFEEPSAGAEKIDFGVPKYLSITIDADNNPETLDPEMLPRQQIVPAIHAYEADHVKDADRAKISDDAEKVGGLHPSQLVRNDTDNTLVGDLTIKGNLNLTDPTGDSAISINTADKGINIGDNKVWHEGNMGSGSGLNADLLDGIDSAAFMAIKGCYVSYSVNCFEGFENKGSLGDYGICYSLDDSPCQSNEVNCENRVRANDHVIVLPGQSCGNFYYHRHRWEDPQYVHYLYPLSSRFFKWGTAYLCCQ